MSHRRLAGITSGLLVVGVLMWWQGRDSTPHVPGTALPASVAVVKKSALPAALPVAAMETLPEFGTEAFNQLAKERGAAWLASRNRDAGSLLAMWDLTGDDAILREAAEKFPGNPQVCLAMLGLVFTKGDDPAEQKKWTAHLIAADPENPLGYYYGAQLAVAMGDPARWRSELELALQAKGKINYYLRERMIGAKEGLLASGVSLKETYFLSLAAPMTKWSEGLVALSGMNGFFRGQMKEMEAPGRETEYQELAGLGLRLAEQQRLTESPSLITELMAHGQRMKFLKDLDPETEIANTGRSVAEELAVASTTSENLRKLLKEADEAQTYLLNAPIEVQGQYADRMMMDGEMSALKYLLEEMEQARR